MDCRRAGLGDVGEDAAGHASEQRGAEHRGVRLPGGSDGNAEDVGLHPAPQRRSGAPAAGYRGSGVDARFTHQRHRVGKAEDHALHHRPHHVGAGLGEVDAEEHAARVGIGIGGALPGEVRKEQEPLAARGRERGGLVEELVGVAAGPRGLAGLRLAQLVAEPSQREPGAQHHTHQVPGVRDGVAERVEQHPLIDARRSGGRQHRSR